MKIVNYQSGLGNQLFYYLMGEYLRCKHPNERIYGYYNPKFLQGHNGLEINRFFDVELPPATPMTNAVAFMVRATSRYIKGLKASDNSFSEDAVYYDGWWQDKKFFLDNVRKIKFKEPVLDDINLYLLDQMSACNSVSLHVRRGDYLTPKNRMIYGGICTLDYYKEAISIACKELINPHFFVFSNDIEWVKENLQIPNATFVNNNTGLNSYLDMYLMSRCKANITANSSFSYWGAMLNIHSPQLVIYPKKWFNTGAPDMFPDHWRGI